MINNLLHSFVVEDEKDEYREALKKALHTDEEAGMNDHLSKLVEPEIIFKTLGKYI